MVRSFLPKAVLLLFLALILAVPAQAAGGRPADGIPAGVHGILSQVWDFLTGVWGRIGCDIDPDGRCVPRPSPATDLDSGCGIDPSGGCNR